MTRPTTGPAASTPSFLRTWLIWTAGFLAFPLAGLAGTAIVGRVDSPLSALTGGAVAGLVIGAGQALLSRRRLDPRRWIPASIVGMGLGLLLGAAAVGYRTSLADLAVMGAITGLLLGTAQSAALPSPFTTAGSGRPRSPSCGPWAGPRPPSAESMSRSSSPSTAPTELSPSPPCPASCFTTCCPTASPPIHPRRRRPPRRRRDHRPARHLRHRSHRSGHLRRAAPARRDGAPRQPVRSRPRAGRRRGRWR